MCSKKSAYCKHFETGSIKSHYYQEKDNNYLKVQHMRGTIDLKLCPKSNLDKDL